MKLAVIAKQEADRWFARQTYPGDLLSPQLGMLGRLPVTAAFVAGKTILSGAGVHIASGAVFYVLFEVRFEDRPRGDPSEILTCAQNAGIRRCIHTPHETPAFVIHHDPCWSICMDYFLERASA